MRLMAGDDVAHQYLVVDKLLTTELAALRCSSSLYSPSMASSVPQQILSLFEAPTAYLTQNNLDNSSKVMSVQYRIQKHTLQRWNSASCASNVAESVHLKEHRWQVKLKEKRVEKSDKRLTGEDWMAPTGLDLGWNPQQWRDVTLTLALPSAPAVPTRQTPPAGCSPRWQ